MSPTLRLTTAQALIRYLCAQQIITDAHQAPLPLFAGMFAIFGHGNVAGIGAALHAERAHLPTYRAHNEQAMVHTAIAFAKAHHRRRMMACTTSIGPGATNMVTAAALAHVNRLPVLLLPGDTFANRHPDPVLQQIEVWGDPTVSVNDCFRPVSRFWDRITRPEQLLASLPHALHILLDPAQCGPVTLALPQDVQAEAFDFPSAFFMPRVHTITSTPPNTEQLAAAATLLAQAHKPLIIAGGGVHYARACAQLAHLAETYGIPVAETQAGKGALSWDHPCNVGAIGVTGSHAANALAAQADVVLCVGTRMTDFTTASRTLFCNPRVQIVQLNVNGFDSVKHGSVPLVCDAALGLEAVQHALRDKQYHSTAAWMSTMQHAIQSWHHTVDRITALPEPSKVQSNNPPCLPTDAQVLGIVNREALRPVHGHSSPQSIVVCAAGGLPGELHKLWRTHGPGGYHAEYGYSCMGYEIAGGLGVKMAHPDHDVYVMVGDGSYLMLNSEIATSIMLDRKLIIVVLDNRGFGCIHRLQQRCGGEPFNNLLDNNAPHIDFAMHARSLGAQAEKANDIHALPAALSRARAAKSTYVVVIETDPHTSTQEGGAFWEVPMAKPNLTSTGESSI